MPVTGKAHTYPICLHCVCNFFFTHIYTFVIICIVPCIWMHHNIWIVYILSISVKHIYLAIWPPGLMYVNNKTPAIGHTYEHLQYAQGVNGTNLYIHTVKINIKLSVVFIHIRQVTFHGVKCMRQSPIGWTITA